MKEATGDLSMTAVAVVAIAAVAVVFTTLIWPTIKANIVNSTKCAQIHRCEPTLLKGNISKCYYLDESGKEAEVTCPNKDAESIVGGVVKEAIGK